MSMPSLKDKENELKISELELLSLIEMGFFSDLRRKKIRFNPRPFLNPDPIKSSQIVNVETEKFVDLHLEIQAKVDALIAENEKNEEVPEFKEVPMFEDYEQTVLNPLKQDLMQRYSLWLE